ncbi:major facilitator superfamily domain-containing protein 12-like [Salvia splendens]|uniref:major facilitator superfamily domain-containing protein 12-like n=1 Tax=Salvia splendens TaxID=180675 RepID=UPI001C25B422|nr:major facilitator superfamily domain-containing protein 12-like [Salvia splendens]
MTGASTDDDSCTKPVGRCAVFYYGVGHMLNDITSACWFTYLLVFMTDIRLSPSDAAIVMLSGQIADGFMTVFSGELLRIDRYGSFKLWHAAGSLLVAASFSSVFGGCMPCKIIGSYSSSAQTISYSVFAAIFNIGWAATQISHMSMVNCITLNSTSRVVMTSCRNAFTMVTSSAMLSSIILVPAVIYVCSFVTSIILQEMAWSSHRLKVAYSAGGLLWMISGVVVLFLPSSMKYFMYLISVVIGVANALMMVSGMSMQSFLVSGDLNECAFVYGSLSFLDKIICGIALTVLESYQSSTPDEVHKDNLIFALSATRYGLGLVPAVSALAGILVTLSMNFPETTVTPLLAPLLE